MVNNKSEHIELIQIWIRSSIQTINERIQVLLVVLILRQWNIFLASVTFYFVKIQKQRRWRKVKKTNDMIFIFFSAKSLERMSCKTTLRKVRFIVEELACCNEKHSTDHTYRSVNIGKSVKHNPSLLLKFIFILSVLKGEGWEYLPWYVFRSE